MCSNLENHNPNDDVLHNNNDNNNNNNNNSNNSNNSSDDNNTNVLFMSYNDIYRILPYEELTRLMVGSKEVWYSTLRIFIGSISAIMVS